MATPFPTLYEFLKAHRAIDNDPITHTRIGDMKNSPKIYPGKYSIPMDKRAEFYKLYFNDVVRTGKKEYLTEKQTDVGPCLVDLDFRYLKTCDERMHTKKHVKSLVKLYSSTIAKLFDCGDIEHYPVYVLEKPDVNMQDEYTKDGIHIVIGLLMSRSQQNMLRKHVLGEIGNVLCELALSNTYESVLDDGISKGHCNWQMFSSCKPFNQTYKLTYQYRVNPKTAKVTKMKIDESDDGKMQQLLHISAHCTTYATVNTRKEYEEEQQTIVKPKKSKTTSAKQSNTECELSQTEQNAKFWDYAQLISLEHLQTYTGWFQFTCLHINIVGKEDYDNYDAFCRDRIQQGYNEANNKTTYDSLTQQETPTWGTLFYLVGQNPDVRKEKYELDCKYNREKTFNRYKFMAMQPSKEEIHPTVKLPKSCKKMNKKERKEKISEIKEFKYALARDMIQADYSKKKAYFEKFHMVLLHPPRVLCITSMGNEYRSWKDIHQMYKPLTSYRLVEDDDEDDEDDLSDMIFSPRYKIETFTKRWEQDVNMRQFETVDFIPPPLHCPIEVYNSFEGFRIDEVAPDAEPQDLSIFLDRLKVLAGNDDVATKYLINYLAHLVQYPGILPLVALVFRSKQGVGKNLFFENFARKILGTQYLLACSDIDKVIGRFNMNQNRLLVLMDEVHGRDTFSNSDKLKGLITSEELMFERKGIDGIKIRNCARYIFFSNNDSPVKIEASDRRYVVFQCGDEHRNDREYFGKLVKAFNDDKCTRAFYDYLKNIDLSSFDLAMNRPITEAYQEIQQASIPRVVTFLVDRYYKTPTYEHVGFRVKLSEMYNKYRRWCNNTGVNNEQIMDSRKFSSKLCSYKGISKKRTNQGMVLIIDFTTLKHDFEQNKLWPMEEFEDDEPHTESDIDEEED